MGPTLEWRNLKGNINKTPLENYQGSMGTSTKSTQCLLEVKPRVEALQMLELGSSQSARSLMVAIGSTTSDQNIEKDFLEMELLHLPRTKLKELAKVKNSTSSTRTTEPFRALPPSVRRSPKISWLSHLATHCRD